MALKFLNKKGWHTGSLRNIENVWKAEQKHEAEQRKLEELKKQIHEEREKAEFRQLQEQAGLISKQDRLDFLYDSGLAVGKGSSSFKALESLPKTDAETTASSSNSAAVAGKQQSTPGALFEDKPQSANDSWRKLHSDPLLLIRQKEQEALARVKNNPIQMAMIRKSVTVESKDKDEKKHKKEHRRKKSKRKHSESDSDSEGIALKVEKQRERVSKSDKHSRKAAQNSDEESSEEDEQKKKYPNKDYKDRRHSEYHDKDNKDWRHSEYHDKDYKDRRHSEYHDKDYKNPRHSEYHDKDYKDRRHSALPNSKYDRSSVEQNHRKTNHDSRQKEPSSEREVESRNDKRSHLTSSDKPPRQESNHSRNRKPVKLSEEERAARLKEMQMDAEKHEELRWKRLKTAAASDAQEAIRDKAALGRNFLDATQKSVYGTEKGGSLTIEESVRRRTHYLQGRSATDTNAFRR